MKIVNVKELSFLILTIEINALHAIINSFISTFFAVSASTRRFYEMLEIFSTLDFEKKN